MRNHDTAPFCHAAALCLSAPSRPGEATGSGWIFESPSLFCVEEIFANARMMASDDTGESASAFMTLSAHWAGDEPVTTQLPLHGDDPLEALRGLEPDQQPDLLLIHIELLKKESNPARARSAELSCKNELAVGLAAIHARGIPFEEVGPYQTERDLGKASALARAAAIRALERWAIDDAAQAAPARSKSASL